jgi:hypothetical protein
MRASLFLLLAGLLFSCTTTLFGSTSSRKALWIEVREKGDHKTTVAVTEEVARELLDSRHSNCRIRMDGDHGLITRAMLKAVLDGEQDILEARDEHGEMIKLYMADLDAPAHRGDSGKLILETFKSGSRTLRMVLPEVEIEASDGEDGGSESVELHLGWKGLLPFLAKEGGAIYVSSEEDDTEVWVYVQ